MKSVTAYEFNNTDIELLKKDLPNNPCTRCGSKYSCCGCLEGNKYNKIISPYVDNNIYEIAVKIKSYKQELATYYEVKERCQKEFDKLPKEIQNILIEQNMIIKEA